MKNMFSYLKRYWILLLGACFTMLVSTVCELLLPTIMSEILISGVQQSDIRYILICCGQMLLVAIIAFLSVLAGVLFSSKAVAGFCRDLRSAVFHKVNGLSFETFGHLGAAALVTRATHDAETVSWVASELAGTIVTVPVLFFGGVILAMGKDVYLSLLLLAFIPVIVAVVLLVGKQILPLWERSDEYIDKQNALMRQRLRGIRVIRAFHGEDNEHDKIAEATRVMAENIIRSNVSMGLITPVATFLLNAATVIIVYIGGFRMEQGSGLNGGDIFAIVQYIALISNGVIMAAFSVIMFPHAKIAAKRINQVLIEQSVTQNAYENEKSLCGNIRFEGVSFKYEGAGEYALKNIDLHIRSGEKIALIGGTGSGKSTVVSLLLGFRLPTEGRVCLDGFATTELSQQNVRRYISCVLQNPSLYSGTIRENVKMGDLSADDIEVEAALKEAQAWSFVSSFSDGIDHEVKQSGKNLSGGQKQRISIARAIVKDCPIYIFDDSFSALDFMTEAQLRKALNERLKGKTQLVITQRVSSAMHCDRIYVLDNGVVVGQGTHEQLLQSCAVYCQIHASQTGGGK